MSLNQWGGRTPRTGVIRKACHCMRLQVAEGLGLHLRACAEASDAEHQRVFPPAGPGRACPCTAYQRLHARKRFRSFGAFAARMPSAPRLCNAPLLRHAAGHRPDGLGIHPVSEATVKIFSPVISTVD